MDYKYLSEFSFSTNCLFYCWASFQTRNAKALPPVDRNRLPAEVLRQEALDPLEVPQVGGTRKASTAPHVPGTLRSLRPHRWRYMWRSHTILLDMIQATT